MRGMTIGLLVALTFTGAESVSADDVSGARDLTIASPLAAFNPGPPLWLPPPMRPKTTTTTDDIEQVIDQCVGDAMALANTPGASVAVIVDGDLVYEQGYGVKRRGGTAAVNAQTRFRIGSVTKMFTAAGLMQQVEAGTVFLDDPVTKYVPEVDFLGHWPAEVMTVKQLLTHATGIPDLYFHPNGPTGPDALSNWATSLDHVGLHAPPGVIYNYSNPNFNLAGLVIERASGMEYRSYMESRVFAPAGLSKTTFDGDTVAAGNATHGHTDDDTGNEITYAADEYDNGEFGPAGYAFSTAGDLVKWARLLSDGGGAVLSSESARAMQAIQQDTDTLPGFGYGYGIFVEPYYDLTVRQHGGNIWGWGSFLLWHPERRFAVAVLANTFQSLPDAAYCIAQHVLEPDTSVVIEPLPGDLDRWSVFEGMYDATVGTGWEASPYPVMGEVDIQSDEQLLLYLWDPQGHWSAFWFLDHIAHDLFYVDVNLDGSYDFDVSFITSPGPPEQPRWLRMRPIVGYPQLVPRNGDRLVP